MKAVNELKISIDHCADDIYVTTTRIMQLEQGKDPTGLPQLWKVLNRD